ncbi:MAG: VWA domain-containing protein, partial [Planctomycetia bacterium]|nr:VWA domain-containing protein [Planctomycetia bacterium]
MNWLPMFGAWQFAAAGVAAAAGTVLIHLLNRRRHQILHWGAMAFLQQVVKKNRRVIQVRDAILLTLRTLAVLLFGLALARPHFANSDTLAGPQPVHAIIMLDNSLSMSYRALDGSLLNQAKRSASELIERLPAGSSVSILTACGDVPDVSQEPTLDLQEALADIEQMEIVDTTATIDEMLARVRVAAAFETNQPRRVVILTDQQATTWASAPSADDIRDLPQLQIVDVAPRQRDNTWVAAIGVPDGFAEARTASTIHVIVERNGGNSVRHAEVSLLVNEQSVATRSVLLQAGQPSQTVTFEHSFITNATSGLVYVPIKAVITPDRLTIDDVRHAFVPVMPRLPIVFVDQFGASEEDVRRGRIGETRPLRRLLESDRDDDLREVVLGQRHVKLDELEAETIEDARLVIVAGVESPAGKVAMLRNFAEAGGQLLITAGGAFSAPQWHARAWLDGNGILPAPLTGRTIGATPDETKGDLSPRLISFDSLRQSSWLRLPGVSDEILRDLYAEPLFFKAAEVDASQDYASAYHTVARLESPGGPPLLVERDIDQGRVMFFGSGIASPWNTLPMSNAIVMLDRLAREMIRSTIADRNKTTQENIQIELPVVARDAKVMLQRPDLGVAVPLAADYLDRARFGVTIPAVYRRGIYGVAAMPVEESGVRSTTDPIWNTELAVNGDAAESNLAAVDDAALSALSQHIDVSVAHSGDEISLADTQSVAHGIWWWFTLAVFFLLLAETLILATAHRQRRTLREP